MIAITVLFPISSAIVVLALSTLPITPALPRTLADISLLGRELQGYSSAGFSELLHVLAVLAVTACWKHAWSIPGSVLLNVLAGVLINPIVATVYMTLLTAVGSLLSTTLSKPLAPLIAHLFPKALALTTAALQGNALVISSGADELVSTATVPPKHQSPAWIRLAVLRLIGVVPWSGINIASGVCLILPWDCFVGAFLGTLPWTAVTVQLGDILMSVAQAPSAATTQQTISELLTSPAMLAKLVFLTLLSLGPILLRGRLSALIGYDADAERADAEMEAKAAAEKRAEASHASTTRARRWSAWLASVGRGSFSKRSSGSCEDELYDEDGLPLIEKHDALLSPA
ncbi:hypothetical protein BKA62DRAFT_613535 [Auriculariales sp. MPI-PUGE-AT-0066]|nr:hypothetical protein BKA62DRAFT_613535 [Auriculariales sp. MPI-PUGE-AT-0066]